MKVSKKKFELPEEDSVTDRGISNTSFESNIEPKMEMKITK